MSKQIIAGPCAAEDTPEFWSTMDKLINIHGVKTVRIFPFKGRTSVDSFQGIRRDKGKALMDKFDIAYPEIGICTEFLTLFQAIQFVDRVDVAQIGARNMYNYPLIEACAKAYDTILLKRSPCATLYEWQQAGEYARKACPDVTIIFCERGIRSPVESMRYTLDLGCLQRFKTSFMDNEDLLYVDPSHAQGNALYIMEMIHAALAMNCVDGLELEFLDGYSKCDNRQKMPTEWMHEINRRILAEQDFRQVKIKLS